MPQGPLARLVGGLTPSAEDDALLDGDIILTSEWWLRLLKEGRPRLVKGELAVAHYHNPHGQGTYGRFARTKSLFFWGSSGTTWTSSISNAPRLRQKKGGPGCGPQVAYTSLYVLP